MYRIFSRFPEETGKWQPSNGEKLAATYPNIDPFLYITISDKLKNNIGRITYSAQRIVGFPVSSGNRGYKYPNYPVNPVKFSSYNRIHILIFFCN